MGQSQDRYHDVSGLVRRPIYLQLRDLFLARIKAGEWRPNQLLPNEVQLANQFEVSVGTIRKVMDELSIQGIVNRQQGRGTFVADLAGGTTSIFDSVRNADGSPIVWDSPRLTVLIGEVTTGEANRMGRTQSNFDVVRLSWLRSKNKRIVALQDSTVPADVGIDVGRAAHVIGLGELFGRAGVLVRRSEEALTVGVPDHAVAHRLSVSEDMPLLHVARRFFDDQGTIVGLCSTWLALKDEYYSCTHVLRYGTVASLLTFGLLGTICAAPSLLF